MNSQYGVGWTSLVEHDYIYRYKLFFILMMQFFCEDDALIQPAKRFISFQEIRCWPGVNE